MKTGGNQEITQARSERSAQAAHYLRIRARIYAPRPVLEREREILPVTVAETVVDQPAPVPSWPVQRDWILVAASPVNIDKPSVSSIIDAVCAHYRISRGQILSPKRSRFVTNPRHLAIFLTHKFREDLSYPQIGRAFNRDHSSIMHAVGRVKSKWGEFSDAYQSIRSKAFPHAPELI